ncbi:MAG: HAD family hydrolase, partial [Pyrinomonadaceae bacterium]
MLPIRLSLPVENSILNMINAILFDFNGVIINDELLQFEVYKQVFKGLGIELTHEKYLNSLGMDENTFIMSILTSPSSMGTEAAPETLGLINEQKGQIYLKRLEEELPLAPGVKNFVVSSSLQFDLGVVSMAPKSEIDYVLNRAGLTDYFAVIVSA